MKILYGIPLNKKLLSCTSRKISQLKLIDNNEMSNFKQMKGIDWWTYAQNSVLSSFIKWILLHVMHSVVLKPFVAVFCEQRSGTQLRE